MADPGPPPINAKRRRRPISSVIMGITVLYVRVRGCHWQLLSLQLRRSLRANQSNIDLPVDVVPLLGMAKSLDQFLKGSAVLRCVFEPSEKIERFRQIPAVMKSPGDRGKIFEADGDVMRVFL